MQTSDEQVYQPGCRLSVFVDENDECFGRPLYHEIVRRAHRAGLAGASVFRGVAGFGAHGEIHTPHLFSRRDDLPVVVVIVDEEERVRAFASQLAGIVEEGCIALAATQLVGPGRRPDDEVRGAGL